MASPLTARELEVLALLTRGLTNREIAERLSVGPGTVNSQVVHMLEKTGARNRTHLAALGVTAGWVDQGGDAPRVARGT
jgi:DNA-binding NarL/FixJ family response regulator